MTPIVPYTGLIKGDKLFVDRSEFLVAEVVSALGEGGVEIIFKKLLPPRSNAGNRYYWGIVLTHVLMALRDLGNDIDPENDAHKKWIHDIMREHYLGPGKWVSVRGKVRYALPSTAKLREDGWALYLDKIRIDVAEKMNYEIPCPPDQNL